tara:strand:+ start:75 stop:311 length:237 start_codon:yes stop_codon:yes gene_type:complete
VAGFYVIESTEPTNRHLACIDYYHARLYCANPLENNKKRMGSSPSKDTMKKKPDLILLIFVIFGVGVAVNALGQVMGF